MNNNETLSVIIFLVYITLWGVAVVGLFEFILYFIEYKANKKSMTIISKNTQRKAQIR